MIDYFSVCSGVEAATVAWHPFGWRPVGFAEIDPFASAVLAERFGSNLPGEPLSSNAPPNYGDFTAIDVRSLPRVDLLVGGTPCQAFSFAGNRMSLRDARGNLTLAYAVLAHELARSNGLRNALWENVPGVLSTDDNAFGCFLGCLVGGDSPLDLPAGVKRWPDAGMVSGPRARLAWRLLDAQYFGLAQRRERVFVVADFGNGADPAEVLFEPQGLRGNSAPRREAGQRVAATLTASIGGCSGKDDVAGRLAYGGGNRSGEIDVAATLTAKGQRIDFEVETFIAEVSGTLTAGRNASGGDRSPGCDADSAATQLVAYAPSVAATLTRAAESAGRGGYAGRRQEDDVNLIAHTLRGEGFDASEDGAGRGVPLWPDGFRVRRLMPHECARLQGFPDHHSRIAWRGKPAEQCPDGPQYKTYGNSMAVNVMAWLGRRLDDGLRRRGVA